MKANSQQQMAIRAVPVSRLLLDAAVLAVLVGLASLMVAYLFTLLPAEIYDGKSFNIWYGADQPRVLANMTDPASDHSRAGVHPIFSILFLPPVSLLVRLGLSILTAAETMIILAAILSIAFLYLAARSIGLRLYDAVLVCFTFMASASFVFWFGLVETFAISAMTLCGMMFIAAARPKSILLWVLGSAATLSITVTNWSMGLLAAFLNNSRRRFLLITMLALLIVTSLALVQKLWIPSASLFLSPEALVREKTYMAIDTPPGEMITHYFNRLVNFWIFPAVNPAPRLFHWTYQAGGQFAQIANSEVENLSSSGAVAAFSWIVLLAAGFLGMIYHPELRMFSLTLIGYLAGQMLLHLVYGDEPFLYSAHFMPAMIMVISFGFLGPAPTIHRFMALLFVITATISNHANLQDAIYRVYAGLELPGPLIKSGFGFVHEAESCDVSGITVVASGTSYLAPPLYKLIVDENEIGEGIAYNARNNSKRPVDNEEVYLTMAPQTFHYESAQRPKQIEILFANDSWAGEGKAGDTNLFIKEIWIDSRKYAADLLETGVEGVRLRNGAMIGLFSTGSVLLRPHAISGCR